MSHAADILGTIDRKLAKGHKHWRKTDGNFDTQSELINLWKACKGRAGNLDALLSSTLKQVDTGERDSAVAFLILSDLLPTHEEFLSEFENLSNHRHSRVRVRVISNLIGNAIPRNRSISVLRKALKDKAASVRAQAAWVTVMRFYRELLPELTKHRLEETDDNVSSYIDQFIPLLQNGYSVSPSPQWPGRLAVSVHIGHGYQSRLIRANDASNAEVQSFIRAGRKLLEESSNFKRLTKR
jgi:hypothetical protein